MPLQSSKQSSVLSRANFSAICDELALKDADLAQVMVAYGHPPMWTRSRSFESLIHIILEQQVSLASALAALNRLREALGQVTPVGLLAMTDEELKACYFSRQKMAYARHLAEMMSSGELLLEELESLSDEEVRMRLKRVKGIGDWTADVYLMFALQRADIFPVGDLALVSAVKEVKRLPANVSREEILVLAERWRPYRSVASMILWHHYLCRRRKSG